MPIEVEILLSSDLLQLHRPMIGILSERQHSKVFYCSSITSDHHKLYKLDLWLEYLQSDFAFRWRDRDLYS